MSFGRQFGPADEDVRAVRARFAQIAAELNPSPTDSGLLCDAIEASYRSGSSRTAVKLATESLPPETRWPQYERRKAELIAAGLGSQCIRPLAELLVRRVIMLAMSDRRLQDAVRSAKARPYWELVAIPQPVTPLECLARNGIIKPAMDAWFSAFPCWRPDCTCRLRTHSNVRAEPGQPAQQE